MIAIALVALINQGSPEPPNSADAPKPHPHWEVAFERGGDVWLARADGKGLKRLVKDAAGPRWSPDGKNLAFSRGSDIWVLNLGTHKQRRVTRFLRNDRPYKNHGGMYADWDPKLPILLCATETTKTVRMVQFGSAHKPGEILGGTLKAPTYAPAWSPSGKLLAYAHGGDVWIADRSEDGMNPPAKRLNSWIEPTDYYQSARRLAPLAVFYDIEGGSASAGTPFWVDELAWTRNERRLVFHFQRIGGSGDSEIGYLDLKPVPKQETVPQGWATWSGFSYSVHWILENVWSPRVCPDGKTLSFAGYLGVGPPWNLYLSSWDGKKRRRILSNVADPDWRPRAGG